MKIDVKSEDLFQLADRDIKDGYIERGHESLINILKDNPSFGKAHNHLGWMYETKFQDYVKAEEHYKKALELLFTLRNLVGAKIVMDIDDNMWQIPDGNVARGANFIKNAELLYHCVQEVDWITVSTVPLKRLLLSLNPNIAILPNYIDKNDWKFKRKPHKKVRIGWVWSPTHIPDKEVVEDALKEVKKKYDVEIVVFGTNKNIFDFDTINIPAVKYTEYPKVFTEAGIDISLGALSDNDFNQYKSNIKYLESTMAGAVFIGSRVYPYEDSIKQGKNGYLAKTKNQWVKYIGELMDKDKRKEILKEARKDVLENYTENKFKKFYKTI